MNCLFPNDPIMAQQVKGHVVCIPKTPHPVRIEDYRPLTLLNAEYKILARIVANKLKPILQEQIHPQQHCGIQGTSIWIWCINSLLHNLEEAITGARIGRGKPGTATVAYADDATVFLTETDEVQALQETLHNYEEATGAKINMDKPKALEIGGWDVTKKIMNISYHKEIRILGFKFTNRSNITNKEHWCRVISQIRAAAQEAYYRKLSLDMRIQFIHDYLLAKVWYSAQIFPIPVDGIRQLNTAISWYLWRGEIFESPIHTPAQYRSRGMELNQRLGEE